jgi:hypothetical protein
MSDDNDALAIAGLIGAIVLGAATGRWWLAVPAGVILVVCLMAFVPAHGGGGVPVHRDESETLDDMAETLHSIRRSQYSD